MPNVIQVNNLLAKYVPAYFRNACQFVHLSYKPVEKEFYSMVNGYNTGPTLRYRKPNYVNVRQGQVADPQDLKERFGTITLNKPVGADWDPTLLDLTLNMDSRDQIMDRWVKPAVMKMGNTVDVSIADGLLSSVYNVVGTAGAGLATFETFSLGETVLEQLGVEDEIYSVLNTFDAHKLRSALYNSFNTTLNEEISIKGMMGILDGVPVFKSNNIGSHTNGTFATSGTVTLASSAVDGATTLSLTGFTATQTGVLKKYDIITVAGVYNVNIMNQRAIGSESSALMHFIVQADVNSDMSGNATVTIQPQIVYSATNPYNNVSSLPASGAAVTLYGGSSATYRNNFFFSKDGIVMAFKEYMKPRGIPDNAYTIMTDEKTGLSFAVIEYYDGRNNINNIRVDFLYGFEIDPQYIVRVIG